MSTPVNSDPKRLARLQRELYPLPPEIRAQLVQVTLDICGLKVEDDGQVTPIPHAQGRRKTSARDKLSAMRILASLERNVLEEQRVERAMEAQGIEERIPAVDDHLPPITEEIAEQALILIQEETDKKKEAEALEPEPDWRQPIAPEPEEDDEPRWPITPPIREAIIKLALALCGLSTTPEGTAEPSGEIPAPTPVKPRIALGAVRVLARLDLLAIQQKRVKYLGVTQKLREKRRHKFVMDPEIERKASTLIHDERVKLLARIEAGDPEAIAAANAGAADQRRAAQWRY